MAHNVRRYEGYIFATSGESFSVADWVGDLGTTSDFRFFAPRGERARISRPSKAFWPFWGIFPGKSWGKHLLQRPPTGFKFRQLRLFPYHLKSAGSDTVPVRVRSAAPRRKDAAAFRFRGFRKSRENSIFAASFLLLPTRPTSLGSRGVPFLSGVWRFSLEI